MLEAYSPVLACAICGGTVDDLLLVLGSSLGLTGAGVLVQAGTERLISLVQRAGRASGSPNRDSAPPGPPVSPAPSLIDELFRRH